MEELLKPPIFPSVSLPPRPPACLCVHISVGHNVLLCGVCPPWTEWRIPSFDVLCVGLFFVRGLGVFCTVHGPGVWTQPSHVMSSFSPVYLPFPFLNHTSERWKSQPDDDGPVNLEPCFHANETRKSIYSSCESLPNQNRETVRRKSPRESGAGEEEPTSSWYPRVSKTDVVIQGVQFPITTPISGFPSMEFMGQGEAVSNP